LCVLGVDEWVVSEASLKAAHKKGMPFLPEAKRLAVRAVKGAPFAFIGAKRETFDRRSGRSRRRFSEGRAEEHQGFLKDPFSLGV
jgi:hypothetical protein